MNNFEYTKESLRKYINQTGLGKYTDKILSITKPSIRIITKKTVNKDFKLAESRFGGLPDVPDNFKWPYHNEIPLNFLVQINLEALKPFDIDNILPKKALISVFYNYEDQPWGFYPDDIGCCRVFYFDNIEYLKKYEKNSLPKIKRKKFLSQNIFKTIIASFTDKKEPYDISVKDLFVFQPTSLSFKLEASFPGHERDEYQSINFVNDDDDIYYDLIDEIYKLSDEFQNRLLGFPMAIQSDQMEQECIQASKISNIKSDKCSIEHSKALKDWVLLMQIDSDTRADMMWGDCGMLYLWIKKDDLIKQNFDNVLLFLQCH